MKKSLYLLCIIAATSCTSTFCADTPSKKTFGSTKSAFIRVEPKSDSTATDQITVISRRPTTPPAVPTAKTIPQFPIQTPPTEEARQAASRLFLSPTRQKPFVLTAEEVRIMLEGI